MKRKRYIPLLLGSALPGLAMLSLSGEAVAQQSAAAAAMLEEGGADASVLEEFVAFVLIGAERWRGEKGHDLVEHAEVPRRLDVAGRHVRQPEEIVGAAGPHAAAERRMPPVEHVAFFELAARTLEDVRSRSGRIAVHEGENVLELVAESKGAARLVEARAGEDSG